MAQIGQFKRTPSGYAGCIRTLTLTLELAFVPSDNADAENAPAYCIHLDDADGPEIGAGWKHTGEKAGMFISVVLDDSALAQPIRARLFQSDADGRNWALHWTRPNKRGGQD